MFGGSSSFSARVSNTLGLARDVRLAGPPATTGRNTSLLGQLVHDIVPFVGDFSRFSDKEGPQFQILRVNSRMFLRPVVGRFRELKLHLIIINGIMFLNFITFKGFTFLIN